MTVKAVLFTRCAHLVAVGGDIRKNEVIKAEINHKYCPTCALVAEEMMRRAQMRLDEMEGWDESSN